MPHYTFDLSDAKVFEIPATLKGVPGALRVSLGKYGWGATFCSNSPVWLDQNSPPHFGRGNPQIHESAQAALNEALEAGITLEVES